MSELKLVGGEERTAQNTPKVDKRKYKGRLPRPQLLKVMRALIGMQAELTAEKPTVEYVAERLTRELGFEVLPRKLRRLVNDGAFERWWPERQPQAPKVKREPSQMIGMLQGLINQLRFRIEKLERQPAIEPASAPVDDRRLVAIERRLDNVQRQLTELLVQLGLAPRHDAARAVNGGDGFGPPPF